MPSAPPNSAPVSEIPDAAPARSGGAAPMIRSFVSVKTGESPSEKITEAATRSRTLELSRPEGEHSEADGRRASPRVITSAGRTATSAGASIEPTMKRERGQRPQPGDERREAEHELEVLGDEEEDAEEDEDREHVDASEALNAGTRNRRRSMSGSASVAGGRRRRPPIATPARIAASGSQFRPSWAICLSPKITASTAASDSAALGEVEPARRRDPGTRAGAAGRARAAAPSPARRAGTPSPTRRTRAAAPPSERADRAAGREARDPDTDRDGALPRVVEHVADQRERRRRERRAGDPEERARDDQHLGAGREGARGPKRRRTRPRRSGAAVGGRSGRRACPW